MQGLRSCRVASSMSVLNRDLTVFRVAASSGSLSAAGAAKTDPEETVARTSAQTNVLYMFSNLPFCGYNYSVGDRRPCLPFGIVRSAPQRAHIGCSFVQTAEIAQVSTLH